MSGELPIDMLQSIADVGKQLNQTSLIAINRRLYGCHCIRLLRDQIALDDHTIAEFFCSLYADDLGITGTLWVGLASGFNIQYA